ncbi:retrovirus-related Pol polyprotein from transposon opus [Trichonephila clavipes]|nr:retrovirus-related Pol polyprotein from transposon opus [Trichonephila clavipes]
MSPAVLMAESTIPVTTPINEEKGMDDLRVVYVKVKGEQEIVNDVIDTGAQMPVVRADVVEGQSVDSGGTIQIMSAFGEREVTELKIFNLKIDDSRHGFVPIICAVSKRLVNDMLVCSSAYEALLENVQFIHNPANSYVSSKAVEGITADDPKSISSQEMTRETYHSEIYIQSLSKANEEEQLPEGRETRSTFIKMQREDDTLKKLWSLAEKQKNSVKIHNGILTHSEYICGENIDQVVLPQCKREVLKMAHDVPLGGHLGEQKTRQRIRDRVPIQPLVRPEIPFEVWSVDCIGPLEPPSRRNHHFIICAVDLCTRWAEAIPVKEISAKTTCNVLLKIFTQTGFPKMICSDQGTNFTSKLSEAFLSVMGVSPRFSTPGHPERMGAMERWNRTLKDMLMEKYLEDFIEKLRKAHEIAAETAEATQNNYASYYNLRSREKQFKVGVLVLLPSSTHKLMKTWIGPATIIKITRPNSAKVELDDGGIGELHFNKLRPYIARVGQVGLIFDQYSDFGDLHYAPIDMAVTFMGDVTDPISSDCQELEDVQRLELLNTLKKFSSLFSSLPGLAKVKGHNLKLKPDFAPKKMHPYRIPIALQ